MFLHLKDYIFHSSLFVVFFSKNFKQFENNYFKQQWVNMHYNGAAGYEFKSPRCYWQLMSVGTEHLHQFKYLYSGDNVGGCEWLFLVRQASLYACFL